jgi:hypothetical protein
MEPTWSSSGKCQATLVARDPDTMHRSPSGNPGRLSKVTDLFRACPAPGFALYCSNIAMQNDNKP